MDWDKERTPSMSHTAPPPMLNGPQSFNENMDEEDPIDLKIKTHIIYKISH